MELSTIIGIVVAVIFIVIALKMIFSKSADPSLGDQPLHVHPETNLPVVPRHLRVVHPEQSQVSNEKIEPTLSDTVLAHDDEHKHSAVTQSETQAIVSTETRAANFERQSSERQSSESKLFESESDQTSALKASEVQPAEQLIIDTHRASKVENAQPNRETVDVEHGKEQTPDVVSVSETSVENVEQDSTAKTADSSALLTANKPALAISTETLEDWEGESSILDLHLTEQERHDEESALACAEHIVALYVWPNPARALSGEKALKILLKYGLRYGEMQCFHRYQQVEETSPLMFSVLRLTDEGPAGFDLESLSTEQVNGLAFFLALPNAHAGLGFDSMASIANHIAKEVDGKVYDENGQELTAQLREHWRHQVIEFRSGQDMSAVG